MIKCTNLSKIYGKRRIFSDFSYIFPDTGVVAIVGESGSGKSTLLNIIFGLDFGYEGSIKVLDKNLAKLSQSELCNFRLKNIGYVFQNFNLLNLDTAERNIYLNLDAVSGAKKVVKKRRVDDVLDLVGLKHLKKSRVNKLSGGEKQRVAIARAIVNQPSIVLCDEPTGALDEKNSEVIFNILNQISKNSLVIIASHDLEGVSKIADVLLSIENEKITVVENKKVTKIDKPLLIGIGKTKKKPKISFSFKFHHSLQKIKAKKYRSVIVNLMLSLSLTGVGLSLIITDSVSTKVNDAFKEIMHGNQITMNLKNEGDNTISATYSAPFDNVYKIYEKYTYLLDGIGVSYFVNYEDFFKDKNMFYVSSTTKKIVLDSYSTRNINDFKWTDGNGLISYPFEYEEIDDDQIILGLTYEDMVNLCFNLQIQRNFTSLGHYIYEKGLTLTLAVQNDFWQYDDEQLFEVVAVCESNVPVIYHTNQLWNENVFEEMMRLPGDDDEEHSYPWEMYKIYYLRTKENPQFFLDASFYDEELYDFVFERSNYTFNPTICKVNEVCNEKNVYVYSADKQAINPGVIKSLKDKVEGLENYYFVTDFGYSSYASNLFSGFSKNVFVSLDRDKIDKAIDADTQLNNEANINIDLPEGVVQGNFLNALGNGLRFSSKIDKLLYGRMPANLNEIVISKGLGEALEENNYGLGKYLTFAGEINEFLDNNGKINKEYNTTEIVIVGVVDEEKNYIYQNSNWTVSFFRDKLGVSNFYLVPRSVVFEFGSEEEATTAFKIFSSYNVEYKFSDPLADLRTNISSTLEYANTILISFSILSTIISILLLGTVLLLNITESKDEIDLFNHLGFRKDDINSTFTNQAVVQGLISFFVSAIELIVVDFVISILLGDYLNIGFQFSFNSKPILIIFLMATILPFLISKIMLLYLTSKRKGKKKS